MTLNGVQSMSDVKKLFDEKPIDHFFLNVLSVGFLTIAIAISFMNFSYVEEKWFGLSEEVRVFNFAPDLISTIVAIVLVAPLYIRNLFRWNQSFYSLIFFVLIVFFFATLIHLVLGGRDVLSGEGNNRTIEMMAVAIILSWVGMKGIAALSWVMVVIAAIISILNQNHAMGFWGAIYIMSGCLGILLRTNLNPGQLISVFKEEYKLSDKSIQKIKEVGLEASEAAKDIAGIASATVSVVNPTIGNISGKIIDKKEQIKSGNSINALSHNEPDNELETIKKELDELYVEPKETMR